MFDALRVRAAGLDRLITAAMHSMDVVLHAHVYTYGIRVVGAAEVFRRLAPLLYILDGNLDDSNL